MATKMVIIVSMMMVGALARKYSQSSDALVAGKENNTGIDKKRFKSVPGNGWCTDEAGQESTARTKTLILRCKHAEMLCEKDAMCVAFACIDSKPFAVLYTTTNCGFACDKLNWITHPKLITKAAFDDRQEMAYWKDGACFVTESASVASTAESTDCDFEQNLCGWSLVSDVKFVRTVGRKAGATSGPQAAHAGTGYALASSSGAYANQKIVLESPYLANFATNTEQALLHFWYNMEGDEDGTLSLKCTYEGALETIWSHTGNQAGGWQKVTAEIPKNTCRFEADTKTAGKSDMAIDDVSITKMQTSLSCNFEAEDICEADWEIVGGETDAGWNAGWGRKTGYSYFNKNNPSAATGPAQAANGLDKYYLVVDASTNNNPSKSFIFRSKPILTTGQEIIKFKYNMMGVDMGVLKLRAYMQDGSKEQLFQFGESAAERTTQEAWAEAEVSVPSGTTMLEFEGITGNGYRSNMAIDEIEFTYQLKYA